MSIRIRVVSTTCMPTPTSLAPEGHCGPFSPEGSDGTPDQPESVALSPCRSKCVLHQIEPDGYGRKVNFIAHGSRSARQGFSGGHLGTIAARRDLWRARPLHQDSLRALAKRYGVNQKIIANETSELRLLTSTQPQRAEVDSSIDRARGDYRRLPPTLLSLDDASTPCRRRSRI